MNKKEYLTHGFKLFQPWATEVVQGNLKFLIRSIPTYIRERVAVIATKGIDGIWLLNADEKDITEVEGEVGAIGSVEIKDCITARPSEIKERLIELSGKNYWDYYPKYLIPKTTNKEVYIWILDKPKKWKKVKKVKGGGITWAKVNLEDE